MSIAETLIDISHESSLKKAEKVSLRLIAKSVKALEAKLKEFGNHKSNCAYVQGLRGQSIEKCDCGFVQALKG